jgi:hypothetical protein
MTLHPPGAIFTRPGDGVTVGVSPLDPPQPVSAKSATMLVAGRAARVSWSRLRGGGRSLVVVWSRIGTDGQHVRAGLVLQPLRGEEHPGQVVQ